MASATIPETLREKSLAIIERLEKAAVKYENAIREATLMKDGAPGAEASSCCRILRNILREIVEAECGQSLFNNDYHLPTTEDISLYTIPIFAALDRRDTEALTWADMDLLLKTMGLNCCSDEAFRLIMLSFGKQANIRNVSRNN
jgi:hypothetical protein